MNALIKRYNFQIGDTLPQIDINDIITLPCKVKALMDDPYGKLPQDSAP